MQPLKWTSSHAIFVTEIDDEHKGIFEALSSLQTALSVRRSAPEVNELIHRLITRIKDHFAHEERLMRAARYESYRWHREKHDSARARVKRFATRLEAGVFDAGPSMVDYLSAAACAHPSARRDVGGIPS